MTSLCCYQGLVLLIIVLMPSSCARARFLYNFVGEYIFANSHVSSRAYEVCDRMAINMVRSTVKVLSILAFATLLTNVQPMISTYFYNERVLLLPIILPCIDPDSPNGFYINLIFQLMFVCPGIIIIFACEMVTCVVRNVFISIAAVSKNSIFEFLSLLAQSKTFSHDEHFHFRSIIQKIFEMQRFVNFLDLFIYWCLKHCSLDNNFASLELIV